jgi:hypothetical protein
MAMTAADEVRATDHAADNAANDGAGRASNDGASTGANRDALERARLRRERQRSQR